MSKSLYDCENAVHTVDPDKFPIDKIATYCKETGDEFHAIGCPFTHWGDPTRFRVGSLRWGYPTRGLTITFAQLDAWWTLRIEASQGAGI